MLIAAKLDVLQRVIIQVSDFLHEILVFLLAARYEQALRSIHTDRKLKRKRYFSSIFAAYSLIFYVSLSVNRPLKLGLF